MTATTTGEVRHGLRSERAWDGFTPGGWQTDHRRGATSSGATTRPYDGDAAFLTGPTARTTAVWEHGQRAVPGGAGTRHPRRRHRHPVDDHLARARLHRPGRAS